MPKTRFVPVKSGGGVRCARVLYSASAFVVGAVSVAAHGVLLRRGEFWLSDLLKSPEKASRLEGALLVFAPSAGEVATAMPMLRSFQERHPRTPILLIATTSTGLKVAGDAGFESARLTIGGVSSFNRLLQRVNPVGMVVIQVCHAAGLPVNLIRALADRGLRTVVVNGYVPERDLEKSGKAIYKPLRAVYSDIEAYCMQTAEDVTRAVQLGVPEDRMRVTGNLKFDSSLLDDPDESLAADLRDALGIESGETLLLAGSTHEGEEEIVLEAFRRVLARSPNVRLIIAPRHVARSVAVMRLCRRSGFTAALRSDLDGRPQVIVLDTMGEMKLLFGVVQAAFVGGSLVPIGGHNVLEPAARGVPVIFGPHTSHTAEAADALLDAGCAFRVYNAEQLSAGFLDIITDSARRESLGNRAREVVQAKSGALSSILRCIESVLMSR